MGIACKIAEVNDTQDQNDHVDLNDLVLPFSFVFSLIDSLSPLSVSSWMLSSTPPG